jgi:hypothetical protein
VADRYDEIARRVNEVSEAKYLLSGRTKQDAIAHAIRAAVAAETERCAAIARHEHDMAEANMARWDYVPWPEPGYVTSEQRQRDTSRASTAYAIQHQIEAGTVPKSDTPESPTPSAPEAGTEDRAAGGRVHELKTWPAYFDAIGDGTKRFECRKDDRGFAVGDVLRLREWDPQVYRYSGREMFARVTFLLHGPSFGVEYGYCVMSIEPALPATTKQPEPPGPLTLEQRVDVLVREYVGEPDGDEADIYESMTAEVLALARDFARDALREAICMCANPECEARSRLTETEINAAIEAAAKGVRR